MVAALPYKKANQSAGDELVRLRALHDKGVLSDEEYEAMRAKLQNKSGPAGGGASA